MSSRKRNWIQSGFMWRGVLLREGVVYQYSGPYDTAGKAKASVTEWKNAGGWGDQKLRDGYVERALPEWERITE